MDTRETALAVSQSRMASQPMKVSPERKGQPGAEGRHHEGGNATGSGYGQSAS